MQNMRTIRKLFTFLFLATIMNSLYAASSDRPSNIDGLQSCDLKVTRVAIERVLNPEMKADPFEQIMAAHALYRTGEKDRAVFWFYTGLLRFRDLMIANPTEGGIVQAFFMAGAHISNHAMHDTARFASVIHKVLEWDRVTPNATRQDPVNQSKEPEFENLRQGLLKMRAALVADGPALEAKARAEHTHLNADIDKACKP